METSTEAAPATATNISAVVQDAVHDGAQDDEALDALPSTGAAAVVCENEDAVFLNVAASVECEDDDAVFVNAAASTRCAPQSLMRAYMRKVMEWRGLSADQRRAAIQTLFLLDMATRGRPFVALHDGMDVVGDVIRSILRHEIVEGGDQDLGEWFRQYKALCIHADVAADANDGNTDADADADKLMDAARSLRQQQQRLSDWCVDTVAPCAV